MTFAEHLIGDHGRRHSYAILIQGIPFVFLRGCREVADAILDLAGWSGANGWTDIPRIATVGDMKIGQKRIDPVQRRMIGGSLTFSMHDDDDGHLAALFTPRARRVAWLTADLDSSTDFYAYVTAETGFADAGAHPSGNEFCYVGAETLVYDGTTTGPPATVNLVGSGPFGSVVQVHRGGTDQGASVFASPPSWFGRRVKVIAFFLDDDGVPITSTAHVLDTFRIEESPAHMGPSQWEIRCSHLSDEVAARKLGTGLRDVESLAGFPPTRTADNELTLTMSSTTRFAPGDYRTWVLTMRDGNPGACRPLISAAGAGSFTEVVVQQFPDVLVDRGDVVVSYDQPIQFTARHIAILQNGAPGVLALFALTSILGDGTGGAYDVLPGYEGTTYDAEVWKFGAGIPLSEIDSAAFIAIGAAVPWWSFVIDKEISVADFLRDFCLVTESFWFIDADGQLTVRALQESAASPSFTLEHDIGQSTVAIDEGTIFPRVRLSCGYDPITQEFTQDIGLIDVDMLRRYPLRGEEEILESRAITLAEHKAPGPRLMLPTVPQASVEVLLRRFMVADRRGACVINAKAPPDALQLELGEVVTVAIDLPDLAGGSTSGRRARVVGIDLSGLDDGEVALTLQLIETPFVVAPAAIISAVAGNVLTLSDTHITDESGSPADMFGDTWLLRVYDVSGNTSEAVYGSRTSATQVTLVTLPLGFTIQAGVDFITVTRNDGRDYAAAAATGYTPDDFLYQQPDDDVIDAPRIETRWR